MVPLWLEELVGGIMALSVSSRMYATRGYTFKIYQADDETKMTVNSGVCSQAGDTTYYGRILEILEVQFSGSIKMKCVVFLCEWFDSREGYGVRQTKFGVTEINTAKRLNNYDPFILASQADQVTYIRYPRLTRRNDPWVIVTKVYPRGRVLGAVPTENAFQEPVINSNVGEFEQSTENTPLVNLRDFNVEDLDNVSEGGGGEDENDCDSSMSEYSSDSDS